MSLVAPLSTNLNSSNVYSCRPRPIFKTGGKKTLSIPHTSGYLFETSNNLVFVDFNWKRGNNLKIHLIIILFVLYAAFQVFNTSWTSPLALSRL